MSLLRLVTDLLTIETDVLSPGISYGKSATYGSTSIMNRSSDILAYSGSSNIKFSFTFDVYAIQDSKTEVTDICESCLALTTPKDPGIIPPSVARLTYRAANFVDWLCVVDDVSISHPSNIWNKATGESMHASITIQLTEVDLHNKAASEFIRTSSITNRSTWYHKAWGKAVR